MKKICIPFVLLLLVSACEKIKPIEAPNPLAGTWELVSGTTIEQGDSTVTDYQKGQRMIKILNDDHFSFLRHDLNGGKDSTALFTAGGGRYTLKDSLYTEYLEFFNDRRWENNTFHFVVTIQGDTLIQRGEEKLEDLDINRIIIEKYVRVKSEQK